MSDHIKITSDFWSRYRDLVRTEMIPFQWNVLNDTAGIRIPTWSDHVALTVNGKTFEIEAENGYQILELAAGASDPFPERPLHPKEYRAEENINAPGRHHDPDPARDHLPGKIQVLRCNDAELQFRKG